MFKNSRNHSSNTACYKSAIQVGSLPEIAAPFTMIHDTCVCSVEPKSSPNIDVKDVSPKFRAISLQLLCFFFDPLSWKKWVDSFNKVRFWPWQDFNEHNESDASNKANRWIKTLNLQPRVSLFCQLGCILTCSDWQLLTLMLCKLASDLWLSPLGEACQGWMQIPGVQQDWTQ